MIVRTLNQYFECFGNIALEAKFVKTKDLEYFKVYIIDQIIRHVIGYATSPINIKIETGDIDQVMKVMMSKVGMSRKLSWRFCGDHQPKTTMSRERIYSKFFTTEKPNKPRWGDLPESEITEIETKLAELDDYAQFVCDKIQPYIDKKITEDSKTLEKSEIVSEVILDGFIEKLSDDFKDFARYNEINFKLVFTDAQKLDQTKQRVNFIEIVMFSEKFKYCNTIGINYKQSTNDLHFKFLRFEKATIKKSKLGDGKFEQLAITYLTHVRDYDNA
jgi:hypothetical protein